MDLIQILSIIGLALGFIGALVVFINSPKVRSTVYLHNQEEENRLLKVDNRKNLHSKIGMIFIAIGFAVQLVAVLI